MGELALELSMKLWNLLSMILCVTSYFIHTYKLSAGTSSLARNTVFIHQIAKTIMQITAALQALIHSIISRAIHC